MKKLTISLMTVMLTVVLSCGVNPQKYFNNVMNKVYIGMPEKDFKLDIEGEQLVVANTNVTIYKLEKNTYNDIHGWRYDHRYFYFVKNKLNKIDKGERAVDYRVKID